MKKHSAFLRGGCWALAIGLPILAIPMVLGLLRGGPLDPRVYSNLLLMPVFAVPIFVFGGFIAMFRALSREAQLARPLPDTDTAQMTTSTDWAHQRTHVELPAADAASEVRSQR